MLLRPHSSVEISGGFDTTSFTIVDSQNSFALLQGKQYEQPIAATLRALVENGLDSQTEANASTPIRVLVKNNDISVTDKGTGISPDIFETSFTKFFASTRTHSNAYHGFFGVGAKAPLSVASKFNVTTIFEGTEYSWECQRGTPAPTAQLLSSKATTHSSGTTVTVCLDDVDRDYAQRYIWEDAVKTLMAQMPGVVEGSTAPRWIPSAKEPVLLIGGMPYPLPPASVLGVPEMLYERQAFEMPVAQDEPEVSTHKGKQFGASPKTRTSMMRDKPRIEMRYEVLTVSMNIGDLDIHFSKERIAFTNANIEKLREATIQQWANQQWSLANEFSVHPQAKHIAWRMPLATAKQLESQGCATDVLAWATRPMCLQGPHTALSDGATGLKIYQAAANSKSNTEHKNWIARIELYTQIQEVKDWATAWGLAIDWNKIPQTNNCLQACVINYDGVDRLPLYTSTLESLHALQTAQKEDMVILTLDEAWYQLDASFREQLSTWWSLHVAQNFIFTPLSIEEVQATIPSAKSFRDYCKEKMETLLANVPEDVLGGKTVVFDYNRGTLPKWASSGLNPNSIIACNSPNEALAVFPAVARWLGMPDLECTTLGDWRDKLVDQLPILEMLPSKLSSSDIEHLTDLLTP